MLTKGTGAITLVIHFDTHSHGRCPVPSNPVFSVCRPIFVFTPPLIGGTLYTFLSGLNYRKVLNASSAFPAPLLDALTGQLYLTESLHFNPQDILLAGDSAGGHLCLALSRYMLDLTPPLAQPGKFALNSPWCDWTSSFPSRKSNKAYDYLYYNSSELAIASAMRYYKPDAKGDVYFSPALTGSGGFAYLMKEGVKVYVQLGTKEVLCDEIRALVAGMERDGVNVKLTEVGELVILRDGLWLSYIAFVICGRSEMGCMLMRCANGPGLTLGTSGGTMLRTFMVD